ncbi:phosphoribosylformylglycinamidine synthase [Pelagirhabdus alkalitolerans]|uniref:Phosphoribosylformylglycinamidine synthase subunit PurS n=1 Tax=Pelagirhabdus alkalitolerans TaxID=1612202 RepID=A0A1G6IU74_9BACI|nr:phosphoribosylformylglycinamidine synthase subunit PurS [Pelagirhabdus alkalitolerans]SDC10132.1 phosphoribosylformylglycinamidine synthase [Pelagirhabdus alkalitolerans]
MINVNVHITLKEGVLDPEGKAIEGSLHNLGYEGIEDVRVGKLINLTFDNSDRIEEKVEEICRKLLANPVIENYTYTIEDGVAK